MKINQINPANHVRNNSAPAFKGKIIAKGEWPYQLYDAFINSKGIKDIAEDNKNITGTLKKKTAKNNDYNHFPGETIYKLKLSVQNEKLTLLEKIKNLFGLNTHAINKNYHSKQSLVSIISKMNKQGYLKRMQHV